MNSIAVPSHPDTAALARSPVVRVVARAGELSTVLDIEEVILSGDQFDQSAYSAPPRGRTAVSGIRTSAKMLMRINTAT